MKYLTPIKSSTNHIFGVTKITKHVLEIKHQETQCEYFVIPSYGYEVRANHNGAVPALGQLNKDVVDNIISEWIKANQDKVHRVLDSLKDNPCIVVHISFESKHGKQVIIYEKNNWNKLLSKWAWEADFFSEFDLKVKPKM